MVEPTIDNRIIRSLSASTREKSPRKKRKKKDNPVDIAFTVKARKSQSKFKIENPKTLSQIDVIRKAAENIEKSYRPESERHLSGSGKLGLGMNWKEAPYGGEHKARFVKAAIRDGLRRGDLKFGTKKGQHLGGPSTPRSELYGKLYKKDTWVPISTDPKTATKNPKTGKPYRIKRKKGDLVEEDYIGSQHKTFTLSKVREETQTNRKGTQTRFRDSFLDMHRQNLKTRETLGMNYDRAELDDVLGQFVTGTGEKPNSKRRRRITVHGNTRYEDPADWQYIKRKVR